MTPPDQAPRAVERREILEERANRDAFRLCVLLLLVIALGLLVLGVAAWRTRFLVMPLPAAVPTDFSTPAPRQPGTPHRTALRPWSAPGVGLVIAAMIRAVPTCRPVPFASARAPGGPAEAMRPRGVAKAAGLQQFPAQRKAGEHEVTALAGRASSYLPAPATLVSAGEPRA